jgi:PAS domain S-box-containing protein
MRLDSLGREIWGGIPDESALSLVAVLDRVHADDRVRVEDNLTRFRDSRKRLAGALSFRVVDADQSARWIEIQMLPGLVKGGKRAVEFSGTLRDITAEKRTEALLIAQQNILQGIACDVPLEDTFRTLVAVLEEQIAAPASGLVLLADPARRHLQVALAPGLKGSASATLEPIKITPGGGVFSAATAFNEPSFTIDLLRDEGWTEIGQLAVNQGWQAAWAMPIRGEDQRVLGTLGILLKTSRMPEERERQVSARLAQMAGLGIERQAARASRERSVDEALWRQRCCEAVASYRDERTFCFDLSHRLAYANPVQLKRWGVPLEKALGKSCRELGFDPWLAELYERNIERVIRTRQSVEGDIPYQGEDGWRLLEYVLVPVISEDGKVEGVSGITRKIKEKHCEEEHIQFIAALTSRVAALTTEEEIVRVTTEMVGLQLGAHRCYLIECLAGPENPLVMCGHWGRENAAELAGRSGLKELGRDLWGCLSSGTIIIEDIRTDPRTRSHASRYEEIQLISCAARPFTWEGRWAAVLGVSEERPRQWTRDEVWVLDEAAARTWPMIERIRSEAALRKSSQQLRESEERHAFLLKLVDVVRPLDDPLAIQSAAASMLGEHLGVSRVSYGELTAEGQTLAGGDFVSGPDQAPGGRDFCGYDPSVLEHCLAGRTMVVGDVREQAELTAERLAVFESLGIRAHVTVPLLKNGQLVTAMGVYHSAPRAWTAHDVSLIEACVDRTWGSVQRARAEKSLRQSEERFRSFAEHSDDILWIVDLETARMEYLSPAFERVYGLDRTRLMDDISKWTDFIHPDDHEIGNSIMPAVSQGRGFRWEFRLIKPDGSICWVDNIAFAMPSEAGAIRRLGGKSQDITDRKRAEVAARRVAQADAFRLAIADALAPLTDVEDIRSAATELLGRHLQATRVRCCELSGDGPEVMGPAVSCAGHCAEAAARPAARYTEDHPRGQRRVEEDLAASGHLSLAQKSAHQASGVAAFIEILLRKGGRSVARLIVEQAQPRRWTEDEVVLVEETAERVWAAIEQASAENKLRESERRLRLVSDHMPALIAYVGTDLRYQFTNREYAVWLGNPGDNFGGQLVSEVLGPRIFEHRLPLLQQALAGEVVRVEASLPHQVLGDRQLDLSLVPDISAGRVLGCYVMAVDVTERLQLVATLREADQRKNEFLATLAHELRNPLAPIRTGVEVLKNSLDRPERAAQVIAVIERQTNQMVRLIDDLLDIARITRGTLKLRPATIDLYDVFADAVEAVRPLVDRARHTLVINIPPTPIYARADSGRLAQIISNLLSNAARYTPEGGHIWLSAEAHDERISIRVRDDGDGIDPAMQTAIFEMFTQIGRDDRPNNEGLGIGLTLVRLLVGLHGGSVAVSSDGIGKGSEFRVELPRAAAPEETGGKEPDAAEKSQPVPERPPCKILVVDDARSTADMMALFLKLEGYETRTAYSGAAALEVAAEMEPQIVFMDIGMPLMDGYETARRLRQLDACRETILIALTGWGQDSDRLRTQEAGFNHHLVKPVEPKMLRELLEELIPH